MDCVPCKNKANKGNIIKFLKKVFTGKWRFFFSFFSQALFYAFLVGTRYTHDLSSVCDFLKQGGVIEPKAGRFFHCESLRWLFNVFSEREKMYLLECSLNFPATEAHCD